MSDNSINAQYCFNFNQYIYLAKKETNRSDGLFPVIFLLS